MPSTAKTLSIRRILAVTKSPVVVLRWTEVITSTFSSTPMSGRSAKFAVGVVPVPGVVPVRVERVEMPVREVQRGRRGALRHRQQIVRYAGGNARRAVVSGGHQEEAFAVRIQYGSEKRPCPHPPPAPRRRTPEDPWWRPASRLSRGSRRRRCSPPRAGRARQRSSDRAGCSRMGRCRRTMSPPRCLWRPAASRPARSNGRQAPSARGGPAPALETRRTWAKPGYRTRYRPSSGPASAGRQPSRRSVPTAGLANRRGGEPDHRKSTRLPLIESR